MEVKAQATVRAWDDEQGWGVLDSAVTPGGCWTHFSALDFDGYRSLTPGRRVHLTAEAADQDGYAWRAVRVVVDGKPRAPINKERVDGAYRSDLTVTFDDE